MPPRAGSDPPDVNALLTQITDALASTATHLQTLSANVAALPTTAPTGQLPNLATELATVLDRSEKDHNGQQLRDFDFSIFEPGNQTYALPSEPRYTPEYSTLIKNEETLFKSIRTRRADPRKASRSYHDDHFFDIVASPHKLSVKSPSYEDLIRGTTMHYIGLQVFWARLAPDGVCAEWVREDGQYTVFNTYLKQSQTVTRAAFEGGDIPGHGRKAGLTDFQSNLESRLDNGQILELPTAGRRSLLERITQHNELPQNERRFPVKPEYRDWGVRYRDGERYTDNSRGTYRDHNNTEVQPVKSKFGGIVQCNPTYDRAVVLSRSEHRALCLVLGEAYKKYLEKGEQHVTGRTDELLCKEEIDKLPKTQVGNFLWEVRSAFFRSYPESQVELVMRIRSTIQSFRFDRSSSKLSMFISQYQAAQSALVKHGGHAERLPDESILQQVLTLLVSAFSVLPLDQQDGLNLAYKELAENYMQRQLLSNDHKHKHVFGTLHAFKAECLRIEDLHPHAVRSETIPDYLQIPHPKEPTPRAKNADFYILDDDAAHVLDATIPAPALRDEHLLDALYAGRLEGSPLSKFAQQKRASSGNDLRIAEARRRDATERRGRAGTPGGYHDSTPHHPHSSRAAGGDTRRFGQRIANALSKAHSSARRGPPTGPRPTVHARGDKPPFRRDGSRPRPELKRNGKEFIPRNAYLALVRARNLAQKSAENPATSQNNWKELGEVVKEVLGTTFHDDELQTLFYGEQAEDSTRLSEKWDTSADISAEHTPAEASYRTQSNDDVVDEVADEHGLDHDEKEVFAVLYDQIAGIDKSLSPAQLALFTDHALQVLQGQSAPHEQLDLLDDGMTVIGETLASERPSNPILTIDIVGNSNSDDQAPEAGNEGNRASHHGAVHRSVSRREFSLSAFEPDTASRISLDIEDSVFVLDDSGYTADTTNVSEMDALNLTARIGSSTRRFELYDTGATNMFRARAKQAIKGSRRTLVNPKKVSTADDGVTAEFTYLEHYNMLLEDGSAIISLIVPPLECPKMKEHMSVTSAHKLGALGVGHFQAPFNNRPQSLLVEHEGNRYRSIELHEQPNGLPIFQLLSEDEVCEHVANGIPRLSPDGNAFDELLAIKKLQTIWHRPPKRDASKALDIQYAHTLQVREMVDEYHYALVQGPSAQIGAPNQVTFEDYVNEGSIVNYNDHEPADAPSELFASTGERGMTNPKTTIDPSPTTAAQPKDDALPHNHPHSDDANADGLFETVTRTTTAYHKSADEIMSKWVDPAVILGDIDVMASKPMSVTVLCCGILSAQYFDYTQTHAYKLPIEITRFCEKDRGLFDHLRKRLPSADAHRDLRVMVSNLRNRVWDPGKFYSDIVEITAVCYDNTILNVLNHTSDHPDADLFLLSVEYVDYTRPKYCFSEMTPMHEHSFVPHYDVMEKMKRAGYIPSVTERAPAAFVDTTNRDRWICFTRAADIPVMHWATNLLDVLSRSPGIADASDALLPPERVPSELWEQRPVERRPGGELERHNGLPSDPRVTGKYLTRAVVSGHVDGVRHKEWKSFDIDLGPLPTITSWAVSRVHDQRPGTNAPPGVTDRFVDLAEFAAATSFMPGQYDYLQTQTFDHAMKIISAAVPVGLLHAIYLVIVADHLRINLGTVDPTTYCLDVNIDAVNSFEAANESALALTGDLGEFQFDEHVISDECFGPMNFAHDEATKDVPDTTADPKIDDDAPVNITTGRKTRVSKASWPPEHPVGSSQRRAAITRIVRLHNIFHVNNEKLEKIILANKSSGCKPGDTRYLPPCERCLDSTDSTPRHHHTPGVSDGRLKNLVPGQKWMIDGGDATVRSRWGSYRYFMVAVDCKTNYLVVYYMVDNTAKSFMQFVRYLMSITKLRTGIYPDALYGDYFSTHLSTMVAQFRISFGIEMESIPPYMHHLNPYAEGLMRILKKACIRRLPALKGKVIFDEVVGSRGASDETAYWPWAMEHFVQGYNKAPNETVEKDTGMMTSPLSLFDVRTSDSDIINLQPFGDLCLVVMQPNQRTNAMTAPTWRATYLFSGIYNPFTHIFSNAPRAHVVVKETGQLQITGRAIFPEIKTLPPAARADIVYDPSFKHDAPSALSIPSAAAAKQTQQAPQNHAALPHVFSSRPLVGAPSPADDIAQPKSPFRAEVPSEPRAATTADPAGSTPPPTAHTAPPAPGKDDKRDQHEGRVDLPMATQAPPAEKTNRPEPEPPSAALDSPQEILEPMRIPPPDALRSNEDIKFKIVGSKAGKSKAAFDLYKSATTPAEFFRLHPGPTSDRKVTANADWKNDVRTGKIVFDNAQPQDLASTYGMMGEELQAFFADHPDAYAAAVTRARNNLLRCFAATIGDELDLLPDEVAHIQDSNSTRMPKPTRQYFNTIDIDETVHDSIIYATVVMGNINEVVMQVEFDKNREHNRRARDDPAYVPKPEDLVVEEGRLQDLTGITDPVERARMVKAIIKEIADLLAIGTFELVPLPAERNAVKSRIVLKVKYLADGTYNKHKARLVAKGFMQRLGVDFFSVFSPMATLTTVRVLLALAVHQSFDVIHADIPQAFVQSILDVDVWLQLPDGVLFRGPDGKMNKVAKLIRSLYGLRNAPQLWNKALTHFFTNKLKFTQASSDGCLFYKTSSRGYVLVACEVDDLVITGSDKQGVADLHDMLEKQYKITDWSPIKSFLGINMKYEGGVLEMDVIDKIRELFKKHGIVNSSHNIPKRDTPLDDDYSKISVEPGSVKYSELDLYLEKQFASIVGALIYISITARPDLAFAIGKLSRGMHQPNPRHIAMLKHTLGYLRKTMSFKMVYKKAGNAVEALFRDIGNRDIALATLCQSDKQNIDPLGGFSDANFANLSDEQRKSISGYCFFLFGCLISWRSKLQTLTAASTFESELIALSFAANEAVWIRKLLVELDFALPTNVNLRTADKALDNEIDPKGVDQLEDFDRHGDDVPDESKPSNLAPTPVAVDNKSVEFSVNNPETSQRTRHLETRYFKVRDYVRKQEIRVRHIGTDVNVSDFFTKALARVLFQRYRGYLGMEDHEPSG